LGAAMDNVGVRGDGSSDARIAEPRLVANARRDEATAAVRDPVFQVEHVSLAYPSRRGKLTVPILEDISFVVGRGDALTLMGPSGSGKSTLLRCLNRLAEPTAACIRFHGRDITSLDPLGLRRRAALVLQTPVLFEGAMRDNLRTQPARAETDLSEPLLVHALAEVGLDPELLDPDGATLSGGEKQTLPEPFGRTIGPCEKKAGLSGMAAHPASIPSPGGVHATQDSFRDRGQPDDGIRRRRRLRTAGSLAARRRSDRAVVGGSRW
jgi:hypothetical protein